MRGCFLRNSTSPLSLTAPKHACKGFYSHLEIAFVTTPATAQLRKTALNGIHRDLGAKMVNFGGWDMPLEYSGILSEHEAVRTRAGLFDVSHMGEIEIRGPGALGLVQWVTCNNAANLAVGQAHYSGLMTDRGTFVDDLLVHKISDTHYLLCVNASNQDRDFDHIASQNQADAEAAIKALNGRDVAGRQLAVSVSQPKPKGGGGGGGRSGGGGGGGGRW